MASKKPVLGKKVNRATEVMNSPMGKAFQSAQGSDSAKAIGKAASQKMNSGKGIVGEGKDVLKAAGNSVKQQAEFVAAVGKGAAKGAGAVAKGAGKVAGKVANITVGDVASAPYDSARAVAKGAGKVAATVGKGITAFNKSNAKDIAKSVAASTIPKAAMPKNPPAKAVKPYTGDKNLGTKVNAKKAMRKKGKLL
jgi:hypothetical protein